MKLKLTVLIPFLLILSTMVASLVVYTKQGDLANNNIRRDALLTMKLDITRLQNVLYNLLTEKEDNLEEARLNLSVTAMDPAIKVLLLADDDSRVMLSNRYIWEGQHAEIFSKYDADLAERVIERNQPDIFFDSDESGLLIGYYPVVLQLEAVEGLSVKRIGILYAEVSIAGKLAYANNQATRLSLTLVAVLLTVTALVGLLLHFLVSNRLNRLMNATDSLAAGNFDVHTDIGGSDELSMVGDAFDDMAKQIKQDMHRREEAEYKLQELNKTLEQRIENRTEELELKKQQLLDSQALAHHVNKMGALGEMASGIAHEINSPLQVITLLSHKIRTSSQKSEHVDIKAVADKIDFATDQVTGIVDSLRKMSRDSSSDPFEMAMVSQIIEDATGVTTERYRLKNIAFEVLFHEGCEYASLRCQRLQVSQIIVNLLNNSYDVVKQAVEKWIMLDVYDTGDDIKITVTDSGEGISRESQEKIFEPMYTTKDIGEGTGLGLSISSEIAHHHGGTLELDKDSEHTRFVLMLPKSGVNQN